MGLHYRKSINLGGGLRVNISQSGIGYSWGVKGYRITKTANGKIRQTVSIPGTGISYSQNVGDFKVRKNSSKNASNLSNEFDEINDIQSVSPEKSSSEAYNDLLLKIKMQNRLFIASSVICFICHIFTLNLLALFFLAITYYIAIKGTCHIEYNFDDVERSKWSNLYSAWDAVLESDRMYQILQTAKYKNPKIHAGVDIATVGIEANHVFDFSVNLHTNIKSAIWKSKKCTMAILPDRLFIIDDKGKIGAIDYNDINVKIEKAGFYGDAKPPKDSVLLKYIWQYANKDGSCDKRYKNNKKIAVLTYGKITFTSNTGLNIILVCSNINAVDNLNFVLNGEHLSD